jgi:uroporphyrinogen III methyltransferase / synthase
VPDPAASPLIGKRVVMTRATAQSSELFAKLVQRGAIPISLPLVSFSAPQDSAPLDATLLRWHEFDWVLFTSARAVQSVVARSAALHHPIRQRNERPRIAVVGPATKDEAAKAGLPVDHVAKTHLGVALAEELASRLRGKNVLLPRSDRANPDLPAALNRLGADLTEVIAYRTVPPTDLDRSQVTKAIRAQVDAVLFFSPSAVHNLADLIGKSSLTEPQDRVAFVAVGPVTSAALHEYGITRIIVASETTADAVISALESHFAKAGIPIAAPRPIAGAKHG